MILTYGFFVIDSDKIVNATICHKIIVKFINYGVKRLKVYYDILLELNRFNDALSFLNLFAQLELLPQHSLKACQTSHKSLLKHLFM